MSDPLGRRFLRRFAHLKSGLSASPPARLPGARDRRAVCDGGGRVLLFGLCSCSGFRVPNTNIAPHLKPHGAYSRFDGVALQHVAKDAVHQLVQLE